jgi:hypothetical protein
VSPVPKNLFSGRFLIEVLRKIMPTPQNSCLGDVKVRMLKVLAPPGRDKAVIVHLAKEICMPIVLEEPVGRPTKLLVRWVENNAIDSGVAFIFSDYGSCFLVRSVIPNHDLRMIRSIF